MVNKIRDIFNTSPERLLKIYETALEFHNNSIGKCSTCKHYIPTPLDLPGFVTDYGECKLCKYIFPVKVCSLEDVNCDEYEEDTESIAGIMEEIKRLKGGLMLYDTKRTTIHL